MQEKFKPLLILGAIIVLGVGLRLVNLGTEPYWDDEVLSLDVVGHFASIGEMTDYVAAVEFHPPLYYVIMHYWTAWFGSAEAATRSLSVIFGIATILLAYGLSLRIFGRHSAAIAAAGMLAILPMQIEYSQEARPYILYCFFTVAAVLALWEYLRYRKPGWIVLYIAAQWAGMSLHYSYFFGGAAVALWWLIDCLAQPSSARLRAFTVWLAVHAGLVLLFAYWLDALLYKILLSQFTIFDMGRTASAMRPAAFFENLFEQVIWLSKDAIRTKYQVLLVLLAKLAFLWLLVGLLGKYAIEFREGLRQNRRGVLFLLWLIIVPAALFFFSPHAIPYTMIFQRHMIFVTVPMSLVLGWLVTLPSTRRAAVFASVFVVSLIPFITLVAGNDAAWDYQFQLKSSGAYISDNLQPGDMVLTSVAFARTNLNHFLRADVSAVPLLPTNYSGLDIYNSRETLGLVENEYQSRIMLVPEQAQAIRDKLERLIASHNPKRVWLYGFSARDTIVHDWFLYHQWRHGIRSISDIYRVDLYASD